MKDLLESKLFRIIILSIAGFIILAFVFGLGVCVGARMAEFSFDWAEQYHTNFAGPKQGFLGGMMNPEYVESNGLFGQIIKVDNGVLTIKDARNATEINVLINEKTTIICQKINFGQGDLKIGDNIIAIGDPNNLGQIQAQFIRVMPSAQKNVAPCQKAQK